LCRLERSFLPSVRSITGVQDLKISVVEILGKPGANRDVSIAPTLEGVQVDLARLDPEPVVGDLSLESVVEGVLVTGSLNGDVTCRCARCLEEFGSGLQVQVCELFAAPGHLEEEEDVYRVAGEEIDLEPMLRDEITLALPLYPLCREDCKGLCARCGRELNDGACDCAEDTSDPRWEALDEVRAKLEQG
jgi:uncharacterized protein